MDDDHSKQSPTNYGSYYAWGETQEKDYYDWSTYIHCDGDYDTCHDLGSDIAGTQYDVAHVQWGGSWVMPSVDQFVELLDNCSSEWTTLNGVNGLKFTGTNSGSIFLPAADDSWGDYWSGTLDSSGEWRACGLYFFGGYAGLDGWFERDYGLSVRPVSAASAFD